MIMNLSLLSYDCTLFLVDPNGFQMELDNDDDDIWLPIPLIHSARLQKLFFIT